MSNTIAIYDEDAERAVLGSLIDYPQCKKYVLSLEEDDFYLQVHKDIYKVITDLFFQGKAINIHIVRDELRKRGIQDVVYLWQVSDEDVPPDLVPQMIGILKEKTKSRRLVAKAQEIIDDIKKGDPNEIAGRFLKEVSDIMKDKHQVETFKNVMKKGLSEINESIKNPSFIKGVPTGFNDLDMLTGGFKGGEFIVIGARPSMGKTTFALNIAYNSASVGKNVLFFSLEMSKKQLHPRMFSMLSGIPLGKINSGMLNDEEAERITKSFLENADIVDRIAIVDDMLYISDISSMAYSVEKVDMIIIDYLQLIKTKNKYQMRYQELGDISASLKFLAKELDVPVVALAQVGRDVEKRSDKRPTLSDLRESGDIEAMADVVMFLHREGYYKKDEDDSKTEVIVSKNRSGEVGKVLLTFDKKVQRFYEIQDEVRI
jgi:replicative DNA helicase